MKSRDGSIAILCGGDVRGWVIWGRFEHRTFDVGNGPSPARRAKLCFALGEVEKSHDGFFNRLQGEMPGLARQSVRALAIVLVRMIASQGATVRALEGASTATYFVAIGPWSLALGTPAPRRLRPRSSLLEKSTDLATPKDPSR